MNLADTGFIPTPRSPSEETPERSHPVPVESEPGPVTVKAEVGTSDDPEVLMDLAEAWLKLGRYQDVEQASRSLFAEHRNDVRARRLLGVALAHLDRPAEALAVLVRVPDRLDVHFARAKAHEQLDELTDAEDSARQVVALSPDDAEAHHLLGTILSRQMRYSEALNAFARATQLDPDHEPARTAGERIRLKNGRLELA